MAVIQTTDCGGMGIRLFLIQGIFVLVLMGAWADPVKTSCEQARIDLRAAQLPENWLQETTGGGEICGKNSCCSKRAEQEMFKQSKSLDNFVRDSISALSNLVEIRARKFDTLFRNLMNSSKLEFHEMFYRTYGKIYMQNSDVFSDFFDKLENYYNKGSSRLSDTLEAFFVILYQRMFTVINSQYEFDDKYLECISEHINDVKPFGDVPRKFTLQLKRSFVATRTYYKSLATASTAAKKLQSVTIDRECEKDLVNMLYCGSCNGLRGKGPCSGYCTEVVGSCLRHHTAFSSDWDNFIDALDKVADRLLGPYNIELVVEPLNIKISEAIMNFQESGTEVSKKIFKFCGEPTLSRKKRKADYKDNLDDEKFEIKYPPLKRINGKKKKTKFSYTNEDQTPLEKLIKEIKLKLGATRQFWAHLPYQFCNTISAPPSSEGQCWNGVSLGEYTSNSSVATTATPATPVKDQIYLLQVFSDKLRSAYHGDEVEIVDDSEDTLDGSGSGSGDFEIAAPDFAPKAEEVPKVVEQPVPPPPSTAGPDAGRPYAGAAQMPLPKAMAQFLLPIVLVWFGGAISDLL